MFLKKCTTYLIGLSLLVVSLTTGCATQRVWSYKTNSYVTGTTPLLNKTVAVLPLSDKRENINENRLMMYLIPLMPFGWQDLQTPEGVHMHVNSGMWHFKPVEDMSKAIAEEVNNSGIFKEAFFTHRASEGELILRGELISTRYKGKLFSYGLSAYGPCLWILPLPSTSYTNVLEIAFKLEDTATKQVLWEGSYKKEKGEISIGLYDLRPDFNYDTLLKEAMKEALVSLRSKLSQN